MKRLSLFIASLIIFGASLAGCTGELKQQIKELNDIVSSLEDQVASLTSYMASVSEMVKALESNEHIKDITKLTTSEGNSYVITFTSNTTITLRDGVNGKTPLLGVQYDPDREAYFWTIQDGPDGTPVYLKDSYGQKVRASSNVPELKVEDKYWWISYDRGASWTKLYEAQGTDGTSVFKKIDTSDPDYVMFTLADGNVMAIPTERAFQELSAKCTDITNQLSSFTELIIGLDSKIFISSVAEIEEDGKTAGWRLSLENGKTLTLMSGKNSTDSIQLGARKDTDGKYYWTIATKAGEVPSWLLDHGKKVPVAPSGDSPVIGIKDSVGILYFTVKHTGREEEWMRGADGNKVQATNLAGFKIIEAVDTSDPSKVVITLGDGNVVTLPRKVDRILTLELSSETDSIDVNKAYSFKATVSDTLVRETPFGDYVKYRDSVKLEMKAIAVDHGYVTSVRAAAFDTVKVDNHKYLYKTTYIVDFNSGSSTGWKPLSEPRFAVFMTWADDRTVMKTISFICKEIE